MCEDTPPEPKSQDTRLLKQVFQRIQENLTKSIPFSEYMEMALYAPELGYYAFPEARSIGRRGDFYTSVSVGDTFGFLLGQRLILEWEVSFGKTDPFVVVEQGAHDGQLACDILDGLRIVGSPLFEAIEYRIVDPREDTRRWLAERFESEGLARKVQLVASLEQARAGQGIFLSNELQDAFPVRRIRFENGEWKEWQVGIEGDELSWVLRALPDELEPYAAAIGSGIKEGYTTEVCPAALAWMSKAARLFEKGLWWVIDYGYGSDDYYAPHRTDGTPRCYRNHRATENPFEAPGDLDITAHVNFTDLRKAAEAAGLKERLFTDQHHFLIEAAKPWLLSMEGKPPGPEVARRMRQFQTLTHPSIMGQQFKVAEYSCGI